MKGLSLEQLRSKFAEQSRENRSLKREVSTLKKKLTQSQIKNQHLRWALVSKVCKGAKAAKKAKSSRRSTMKTKVQTPPSVRVQNAQLTVDVMGVVYKIVWTKPSAGVHQWPTKMVPIVRAEAAAGARQAASVA